ncbi:hypothetical protein BQ8482_570016 [Mesorhizobium delmotii]|uniref:Uncharacterized protein n=1 Tax=Mesorhizobium delmotii TaxID=1631247 RepID=A0A2P9AV01_9HYPH|nr:hypothetical protein BQ8482_570016 [Mesorhizobium delmotii]
MRPRGKYALALLKLRIVVSENGTDFRADAVGTRNGVSRVGRKR